MLQIYLCYLFQLVLIFGPFWVIFGPFGQFWVIFGPFGVILGSFWVIFGAIFFGQTCISAIFITFCISGPNDVCYLMKVAFNAHPQWLLDVFLLIKGHTSSILGRHLEHCRVPGSGLESPQSCGSVFAPRNEPESRFVRPLD